VLYEYAENVFKRNGKMVAATELAKRTGFRSLYGFSEEDAKVIVDEGASRGFSRFPVYAEQLVLDFDEGYDDNCKRMVKWCKQEGYSYTLWVSGSKGYHLEIEAVPKYSKEVPFSQQKLLQSLAIETDYSLYQHSRLYRLPNTVHAKTGKRKVVQESYMGEYLLDYELLNSGYVFNKLQTEYDESSFEVAMRRVTSRYGNPLPKTESRTQWLWATAKKFSEAGMSRQTTLEMITYLNKSWGDQAKDADTIARVVREAYKNVQ